MWSGGPRAGAGGGGGSGRRINVGALGNSLDKITRDRTLLMLICLIEHEHSAGTRLHDRGDERRVAAVHVSTLGRVRVAAG